MRSFLKHLAIMLLLLMIGWNNTYAAERSLSALQRMSTFLESHNALASVEAGIGYARNVYLVATNEESDLFLDLSAETEWRKELDALSDIYCYLALQRKQFISESDASEMFFDLAGEYYRSFGAYGVTVSAAIDYEDYRSFDEEGGVLPIGEYESWAEKIRAAANLELARDHVIEGGLQYRLKNYTSSDLDFNEITANLEYTWHFNKLTRAGISFENQIQDYDSLQALSQDGSLSDSNPTIEFDTTELRMTFHRGIAEFAWCDVFIHTGNGKENFEGEGSYGEFGLGGSTTFQVGNMYAFEGRAAIYNRNYDNRMIPGSTDKQTDDFISLGIAAERGIKGSLSCYCSLEINTRNSNDDGEDYNESSVAFGIKSYL